MTLIVIGQRRKTKGKGACEERRGRSAEIGVIGVESSGKKRRRNK